MDNGDFNKGLDTLGKFLSEIKKIEIREETRILVKALRRQR